MADTLDLFDTPAADDTPPDRAERWRRRLDGPIVPRWLPGPAPQWRAARRDTGIFMRGRDGRPLKFDTEADALAWIRDNPRGA